MTFTVIPPAPAITDFLPRSGTAGDEIVLTGTNFTGATSVKFNGVPASFTVDSDTQIMAVVPTGCSSGLIEIATNGGTVTSSTGFTVTIPGGGGGSALAIFDEGTQLSAAAASINFVGAGVTASNEGDVVTVNIPGGGEVGGGGFTPAIKTVNYTAAAGDVIIADTSGGTWDLTLPETPVFGDAPITVYGSNDFSVNPLNIKLGGANKYQRKTVDSSLLQAKKPFSSFKLIYAGSSIGWLDSPQNSLSVVITGIANGAALWLRGSLSDLSGNDRNATPFGTNSPSIVTGLDDNPALKFTDAGREELQVPYFLSETTAATLYIVFAPNSDIQYNLIKTAGIDDYWCFSGDRRGYFGTFQSSRNDGYPTLMPSSGNHLVSIHTNTSSYYEVLLNNTSQGILNKSYSSGDRFKIAADSNNGKQYDGQISEIIVYPFLLNKNSAEHQQNINYLKARYPSLALA
jgi:hypothetical protein